MFKMDSAESKDVFTALSTDDAGDSRSSKQFRFKLKSDKDGTTSEPPSESHKRHRHHHHSRHSKRRKTTRSHKVKDPIEYNGSVTHLSPDKAFRESLFDALGDDEGAAYWEGVYGQPIHNYPSTYEDEETGELEKMDEEEYAQFVRRKMWEKSREGIEAASEEKKRQREMEKQRIREEERDRKSEKSIPEEDELILEFEIEASLRSGMERKDRKRWQRLWNEYLQKWDSLQSLSRIRPTVTDDVEQLFLRNKIAWPVQSGKRKDVNTEEIEKFVTKGTEVTGIGESHQSLADALKLERLRWHPDKIQQRYGFMNIDDGTVKGVTAVFQVFDRMWNELKRSQ